MKNRVLELLSGIDANKLLAMINRLGGRDVWDRVESGELVIRVETIGDTKQAVVAKRVVKFFDRYGHFIPCGITASHNDPNRDFVLASLRGGWAKYDFALLDLSARVERLYRFIPSDVELFLPSAGAVLTYVEMIRARVRADKTVANVLNGPNLPTFLPKFRVQDLGALVEVLVTIVKRSYEDEFSGRTFYNHQFGNLAGKVSVVEVSRFQQVIAKMAESHVPGLEFFTPFQGFSIQADHEAIALLPEEFILSALDTLVSFALYPDILLSNWHTPGYDLAGLLWGSSSRSLCGGARDDDAVFHDGDLHASDDYSASLFLPR